jgi:hypothetical protein
MQKYKLAPVFLTSFKFLENLNKALGKKGILACKTQLFILNGILFLNLRAFIRYKLEKKYKKRLKPKKKFFTMRTSFTKFLNVSKRSPQFHLVVHPLNKKVNLFKVKLFFKKFKYIRRHLLKRRNDLFSDLLNLSSLFVEKYVNSRAYLSLLAQIFNVLLKRGHTQYLYFITMLLNFIMTRRVNNKKLLNGIKFWLKGKLKGKPRKSKIQIIVGRVPCQQTKSIIDYSKQHIYNRYGAFGFKLWTHY